MKISVIIPTYNEETQILSCLTSLMEQSEKDFEVIVVDDGSSDRTLAVLKGFNFTTDKLRVFSQQHKGPAMARNLGAKSANGRVLVFVDADMTFDKDFLGNLTYPLVKNKTKGTFSKDEYVSNWENVWARCWNINENLPAKKRLPNNYPNHQKVFRAILKSEFERVGGFSQGGYTDDYTLSTKLGYEASVAYNATFYHKNPDSLKEVFSQARWVGKRDYKLGLIGIMFALIRSSLPISKVVGLYKGFRKHELRFFVFKIVYDLGIFIGILEMVFTGKTVK